ncbi:heterodisulfide reductase-related iron-sulfur binding cluster [Novosphingobium lentum]|uniref:heterodisulfide reductase-related iron-sulfur binding cluster n=1 Tax=Novosphingobium lentum TaxID=145287 RepID=UPI000832C83B|nr:heterodisulfide reductase-related iron-sulfur binding cluster [Novosphingobium lentum]
MEGSLDAPTRHVIAWRDEAFYDEPALEQELRRVFDICHGCRRCFNLCDSFPVLFDAIDESPNEEVGDLSTGQLKAVVDACTLCDMCFMTKCPYVPPHTFDLDFPHLMLRHRAVENRRGETSLADRELAKMDRNGKLGSMASGLANWATKPGNALTRPVMEMTLGIDTRAHVPPFEATSLVNRAPAIIPAPNPDAPGFGRKVVLYAGCHDNFNDATPGEAAMKVLAHNGVLVRIEHPDCCAMPKFENGDLAAVANAAERISAYFAPLIAEGWDIVPLTTSCALMLKFEWPLIEPDNENVALLSKHTFDVSEYVVALGKAVGLAPVASLPATIGVHFACHARAQNMGPKAMEMLKLIPEAKPMLTERCSGHGGKWGIFAKNFDTAIKIGKPTARAIAKNKPDLIVSECPLAGPHLKQVMEANGDTPPERIGHPIEVLARAYGL